MADETPATRDATFTNRGVGPRSIIDSNGTAHILRSGETVSSTFREADLDGISSDLVEGDPADSADRADASERQDPLPYGVDLEGLNKNQLLQVAIIEGLSTLGNDGTEDDIRDAIQAARDARAETGADAAEKLLADRKNTVAVLSKRATDAGVTLDGNETRADLAAKVAAAEAKAD